VVECLGCFGELVRSGETHNEHDPVSSPLVRSRIDSAVLVSGCAILDSGEHRDHMDGLCLCNNHTQAAILIVHTEQFSPTSFLTYETLDCGGYLSLDLTTLVAHVFHASI
jgi:hypothetical protein